MRGMSSDNTNPRLDALENTVARLADQVSKVVTFFERLVVVEERNSAITNRLLELKSEYDVSSRELRAEVREGFEKIWNRLDTISDRQASQATRIAVLTAKYGAIVAVAGLAAKQLWEMASVSMGLK
ncbi:hypothetical protein IZ6_24910 [Terrihabitans soli]|uniref:DUF1515 domain-containing protein n=2 Tax=Terrihabitans soli TaxID=708113 RepID=A0A6S6QQE4_9HYPH|nr:hypothetical protein IZ6_24910 [Terrihabitans soli]